MSTENENLKKKNAENIPDLGFNYTEETVSKPEANNVVRGSYGLRDADGKFRTVTYTTDSRGFPPMPDPKDSDVPTPPGE
ncbi:chitin-binding domain-containing protein [uncultured Flavobacterium sp.]|uniref:chitin-binding domain-containing protein n=1 Tax=uncultured Flavobacterium sp. TaxID=165435 RepID=UPI0029314941|nr:chitin-binding domain-containing protein [uncultured Flavobacterium sp.]